MISIQRTKAIRDALTPLTERVYHFWRPNMQAPFIVWAETSEGDSFSANDHKQEQVLVGNVELFTKEEYDPLFDEIQEALLKVDGLGWTLTDVNYEDGTGLIHYVWEWNLI